MKKPKTPMLPNPATMKRESIVLRCWEEQGHACARCKVAAAMPSDLSMTLLPSHVELLCKKCAASYRATKAAKTKKEKSRQLTIWDKG